MKFNKLLERKSIWILPFALWAFIASVLLLWNLASLRHNYYELALNKARTMFNLIQITRLWNAKFGGVYVPITDKNQPNPYLDVPDRDIVSDAGIHYTKINPAYMTRQIAEIAKEDENILFHITSLNPIRPANKADEWETKALKDFEKGKKEVIEIMQYNENTYFRYMSYLEVKEPCLQCHSKQGYKLGDIRGGISVSIPAAPIISTMSSQRNHLYFLHAFIFLFGSLLTSLVLYNLRKHWIILSIVNSKQEKLIEERTYELKNMNDQLIQEIGERKKTEATLRDSEMRLTAITNSAIEAIISINSSGIIVSWNKGANNIFGYSEDESIGKNITMIMPNRFVDLHKKGLRNFLETGKSKIIGRTVENYGLRKDRYEFPIEISLTTWKEGEETFFTGIIRDTSHRKKMEEELLLSKVRLQSIMDNSPTVIYIMDADYKYLMVNYKFEQIFNRKACDCIGKKPFDILSKEMAEYTEVQNKIVLETGNSINIEENFCHSDGSIHTYMTIKFPLIDTNNVSYALCVISTDITEKKRSEIELRELNMNLEKKVKQEIEKRRQKEQLLLQQSKMAAMGEMIGAIAHQWRQPLNSLAIIVQDIEDAYEYGELNKEYLSDTVVKSMNQIKFMSKTIDDFRNFFIPSKEKSLFNVKDAIENVISIVNPQLKNNDIAINIQCDDINEDLLIVSGFPNEFKQVIINLINNAKDAILDKTTKVHIKNYYGRITIKILIEHDNVVINVIDNAGGIGENIIERIFEPYFTTKEESKGTGIGLYMSKTIVEKNMGGKLFVENIKNGASFYIKLPIVK
ncbi:PAS sensor protein [Candidatus Magnetoovum chiemensis]|nr:PAS sensor protein [Candidatus Magnetoovum chiemensis]